MTLRLKVHNAKTNANVVVLYLNQTVLFFGLFQLFGSFIVVEIMHIFTQRRVHAYTHMKMYDRNENAPLANGSCQQKNPLISLSPF